LTLDSAENRVPLFATGYGLFEPRNAGLRQFALCEGFFCAISYRIGKQENSSDPARPAC
jgi:hypothetical protein